MKEYLYAILFLLSFGFSARGQNKEVVPNFDSVRLDTSTINVFKGAETARVKIDYYHSSGYSLKDRYWYEVVIIDSLVILNFQSPDNDDWNYINYQKQVVVDDSIINNLLSTIKSAGIKQKKKGVPLPPASGYTANRLYIQTKDLQLAGGTVYIGIGSSEDSEEVFEKRIKLEQQLSTTIAGNYELVFTEIVKLFPQLDFLLKDMVKE